MTGEQRYQIPVLLDQDGVYIVGVDDLYIHDFVSQGISTERQVFQEQCAVRPGRATCSDGLGLIQKLKLHAGQRIPGIRRGLADENTAARSGIGEILYHRLIGLRKLDDC